MQASPLSDPAWVSVVALGAACVVGVLLKITQCICETNAATMIHSFSIPGPGPLPDVSDGLANISIW